MSNDEIYARLQHLRLTEPLRFYQYRIAEKYDSLLSSAKVDDAKKRPFSAATLDRVRELKSYRKAIIERGVISFEQLRDFEKSRGYDLDLRVFLNNQKSKKS